MARAGRRPRGARAAGRGGALDVQRHPQGGARRLHQRAPRARRLDHVRHDGHVAPAAADAGVRSQLWPM